MDNNNIPWHILQGKRAEQQAARYLKRLGYRILKRNHRTRRGELDLVARDGDCLVFVEVKARNSGAFGPPEEALTPTKQRRLWRAAQEYLQAHPWAGPVRFDVVALKSGRIALYRNALEAPCTRAP